MRLTFILGALMLASFAISPFMRVFVYVAHSPAQLVEVLKK